jgi:uncharacterized protein
LPPKVGFAFDQHILFRTLERNGAEFLRARLSVDLPECSRHFGPLSPEDTKMPVTTDAVLLRIFVGENDSYKGKPLFLAIIAKARENHVAGATVLHAHDGFGISRAIRTEYFSIDGGPQVPIVVEMIDSETKINEFLPIINEMIESGLVTLEKVRARQY